MTVNIKIIDTGHEFTVFKSETLLSAGLDAGLSLEYNCNNGVCGKCKAKIVTGEVEQTRFHDFKLDDQEKDNGIALLCCVKAKTDLEIEAGEAHSAKDIPFQQIETKVSKIEHIDDNHVILQLRTPRSQTLRFLSGQHVLLKFKNGLSRNKSIACSPYNAMNLQFHFRHVENDECSDYLLHKIKKSEKVIIEGPIGDFIFNEDSEKPLLLFAYETGFAPIKSLIEHCITLELTQPIHLYWLANQKNGIYMDNICHSCEDAIDNLKFEPVVLNLERENIDHIIAAYQTILKGYDNLKEWDIYMTAPHGAMDGLHQLMQSNDIEVDHYKIDVMERF